MKIPKSVFREDLLASVVVFLVALPLCMGIAIASGVPPALGLITGIVGGLVVGFLAGSPLQVSGPAAGLAVIVYEVVQAHGIGGLGIAVLVGGIIQLAAGLVRVGQWFRAVSPAVIKGMLAGIGVLIFSSQFHVMVDDKPPGGGIENLITIPQALMKGIVPVDVGQHRERLFAIKNEEMPWDEIEAWRKQLHAEFDRALEETDLPERPDYERANEFLVKARRLAVAEELP